MKLPPCRTCTVEMFWACTEAVGRDGERRTFQCQMCGDVLQYFVIGNAARRGRSQQDPHAQRAAG